jgi:hypothetical protein
MQHEPFLTLKEIAFHLRRSRTYCHALKQAMARTGNNWPGGRITLGEVVDWLRENPEFSTLRYVRGRKVEQS